MTGRNVLCPTCLCDDVTGYVSFYNIGKNVTVFLNEEIECKTALYCGVRSRYYCTGEGDCISTCGCGGKTKIVRRLQANNNTGAPPPPPIHTDDKREGGGDGWITDLGDPTSTAFLVMILICAICLICCIMGCIYRYWKNLQKFGKNGVVQVSMKKLPPTSPTTLSSANSQNNHNGKMKTYSSKVDVLKDNLRMISTDAHNVGGDNLGRDKFYQINKERGVFNDELDDRIENELESSEEDSVLGKTNSIVNDVIVKSSSDYQLDQLNLKHQMQNKNQARVQVEAQLGKHLSHQDNRNRVVSDSQNKNGENGENDENDLSPIVAQSTDTGSPRSPDSAGSPMIGNKARESARESEAISDLYAAPSSSAAAARAAAIIHHRGDNSSDSSSSDSENARITAMAIAASQGTRDPRKPSAIVQSNSNVNIFNNNGNMNVNNQNVAFGQRKNYYNNYNNHNMNIRIQEKYDNPSMASLPNLPRDSHLMNANNNDNRDTLVNKILPNLPRDSNIVHEENNNNYNNIENRERDKFGTFGNLPQLPRATGLVNKNDLINANLMNQNNGLLNVENDGRERNQTLSNVPQLPPDF